MRIHPCFRLVRGAFSSSNRAIAYYKLLYHLGYFKRGGTCPVERTAIQVSSKIGAGDEARTRDPQLGKLMLYQLSYTRLLVKD
jgi:hypothetical protein